MKKCIMISAIVLSCLSFITIPIFAEERPFSLSLAGQIIPFISGDAGNGEGAPAYDDAFDKGKSIAVEATYRINPKFSMIGGIGYETYSGDMFQDISFDDLKILPIYLGGKYHFFQTKKGWNPYLRADIGMAKISDVDISYLGATSKYWDDSWEFMADAGAGIEYRFNTVSIFFEVKARYLDKPSESQLLGDYSKADSSWSIPISLGISYYF